MRIMQAVENLAMLYALWGVHARRQPGVPQCTASCLGCAEVCYCLTLPARPALLPARRQHHPLHQHLAAAAGRRRKGGALQHCQERGSSLPRDACLPVWCLPITPRPVYCIVRMSPHHCLQAWDQNVFNFVAMDGMMPLQSPPDQPRLVS